MYRQQVEELWALSQDLNELRTEELRLSFWLRTSWKEHIKDKRIIVNYCQGWISVSLPWTPERRGQSSALSAAVSAPSRIFPILSLTSLSSPINCPPFPASIYWAQSIPTPTKVSTYPSPIKTSIPKDDSFPHLSPPSSTPAILQHQTPVQSMLPSSITRYKQNSRPQ